MNPVSTTRPLGRLIPTPRVVYTWHNNKYKTTHLSPNMRIQPLVLIPLIFPSFTYRCILLLHFLFSILLFCAHTWDFLVNARFLGWQKILFSQVFSVNFSFPFSFVNLPYRLNFVRLRSRPTMFAELWKANSLKGKLYEFIILQGQKYICKLILLRKKIEKKNQTFFYLLKSLIYHKFGSNFHDSQSVNL